MKKDTPSQLLENSTILPLVLFGPSGAGKTAVKNRLMERYPQLFGFSVSATTRPKRDTEVAGKDYHFLTEEEFSDAVKSGQFFEWKEVYPDLRPNGFYGTLNSEIEGILKRGKVPLFDVDVDGALHIIDLSGSNVFSVAITATEEKLKESVTSRKLDSAEHIAVRVDKGPKELVLIIENTARISMIVPRIEHGLDAMVDQIIRKYSKVCGIAL